MFGPNLVVQYVVDFFLVFQSSHLEREDWLPYINCLLTPCDSWRSVSLPLGVVGSTEVYDCGNSWAYSLMTHNINTKHLAKR